MIRAVLVTGGAGFVGSHLCRALVAAGLSVVAVDNLQNGLRSNVPEGVELVLADLSTEEFVTGFAGRAFDAVIHCAAQSSNALSFRDPVGDAMTNQVGTLRVLELCRTVGASRLLFTSSMSVYGQAERLPTPEAEPLRPQSFYAVHKAASEYYIRLLASQVGVQATIFRLFTTYGPGQNLANRDQGLVSIYLSYLLRGEPIVVRGSGERRRDLVYIDDVVSALWQALHTPATTGQTYNLGSGETHRIADILRWLIAAAGERDDYPVRYEVSTSGDPNATHADINLIRRALGWAPGVMVAEGLRRTVEAYQTGAVLGQA